MNAGMYLINENDKNYVEMTERPYRFGSPAPRVARHISQPAGRQPDQPRCP